MAARFDPTRQRYDVAFNKRRLICASSKMDSANTHASQHFRAKSRKEFYKAIKSTAREVDPSGELPVMAYAVSSISFVELISMLKRCGMSNRDVFVFFKKDLCYLVPANHDSDSDSGSHNSDESTGSVPDGDGGESGLGDPPMRVRSKKMYTCCWFLLLAVVVSLMWKLRKPDVENVVKFVWVFTQLVYKLLKRAPEFGGVIVEFLKSLYDILNMIINLLQSWKKLRFGSVEHYGA